MSLIVKIEIFALDPSRIAISLTSYLILASGLGPLALNLLYTYYRLAITTHWDTSLRDSSL